MIDMSLFHAPLNLRIFKIMELFIVEMAADHLLKCMSMKREFLPHLRNMKK